jgi:hypothetical protein
VKKFIYAITPFCIYSFFVLLFYYVADYLAPTHNMELARYLFALFYLFHALIGVFVLGFIFEKIKKPLTDEILFGKLKKGGVVKIDFKDDFVFIYE